MCLCVWLCIHVYVLHQFDCAETAGYDGSAGPCCCVYFPMILSMSVQTEREGRKEREREREREREWIEGEGLGREGYSEKKSMVLKPLHGH